jgi:protein-S-isoprenylcysteine O-methyltransferase Ste14
VTAGSTTSSSARGRSREGALTTLALAVRAGVEERFLAANPAYRAYCAAVRWRFVPGLY